MATNSSQGRSAVTVKYFALLRERIGLDQELIDAQDLTVGQLYERVAQKYGLELAEKQLRCAVNDEFCSFDHPLEAGDEVIYLPPVSGG